MNTYLSIALKVFIRSFYLDNATFFLFILGICAGFMRGSDHVVLAEFFVSQPYLVVIPFILWSGYALKIQNFNKTCLTNKENNFFFYLIFFQKTDRLIIIGSIVLNQLLPVILYGIFLMIVAVKQGVYNSMFTIMICLTFLSSMLVIGFHKRLQHPHQTTRFIQVINQLIIRPYPLFSVEWLARKKTMMLFGSKIFTMLILIAVATLYKNENYDFRLMGMGIIVAISAGAQLMFEVHRFDNLHFVCIRQLPIPLSKRILYLLATIVVLTLPEAGVIINYFTTEFSILEMAEALVFLITGLFFWYGILYLKNLKQEGVMKMVFNYSMVSIVLILFKVPVWALAGIQFLAGTLGWLKYYYQFEYTEIELR